jgi:TolB protein
MHKLLFVMTALIAWSLPAQAAGVQSDTPLYPVSSVVSDNRADFVYPSIVGNSLVYSVHTPSAYSVVQANTSSPASEISRIKARYLNEALRFGVALQGGAIGYVSNRMGPVSAWMRMGRGDGHVLIGNMGVFSGALVPMNLHASYDGRVWCFDTTMEKVLQSRAITQFSDLPKHPELLGQTWRFYDSNSFEHRQAYKPTETGVTSSFYPPSLFIFERDKGQLTMIPNALDGAISPDGKHIAFVRNTNGNYDIWLQDVDGSDLIQLTSTKYGDFEPAWSPDGKQIAFVSNRDSKGNVLETSIYVLDVKTGQAKRLTNAPNATDGAPAWKDEHTIIFHSNRDPSHAQKGTVSRWSLWQVSF